MLDGLSALDTGNNGLTSGMNLPADSIAEIKVVTSGYSAEYGRSSGAQVSAFGRSAPGMGGLQPTDTARYAHVEAAQFHTAAEEPLSTFGADVDTASFTNVRRFLTQGQLPPTDAVRVEEFVNYFKFDYAAPRGPHPIGLTTEVGDCPWAPTHKLVLIGARAAAPATREIAGRNLVLLVDVSGSMSPANRLPMIKSALSVFVDTLSPDDRLTIVTYAGYSGVALPTTPARQRTTILSAIASLGAGGSTNGAQGIVTAYRAARAAFIPHGVNRVILATDGDFNVGITSRQDLLTLIEHEKQSGIFLSVLGVGDDNLQDATMEMLADKGNGHYAYLDSLQEARRVLVQEAAATLETVAKEVKFQVEFNPAHVAAWKLIGYENRKLAAADFNNDRKDGGEMGAGHTVTVLYEVVPAGAATGEDSPEIRPSVDPLRYQQPAQPAPARTTAPARTGEWMTVKVRYQLPEGDTSRLIEQPIRGEATVRPQFLPFASAVADFGLLLRDERAMGPRWEALTSRLKQLSRTSDRDAVAELVGLAASLKRVQ
jgi:Ca-activated chloride channel family protein